MITTNTTETMEQTSTIPPAPGQSWRPPAERQVPISPNLTRRWTGEPRAAERLATGLGWFSIGLGAMEVLMPKATARLIGVKHRPALLRSLGAREIMSGVGILTSGKQHQGSWVWSRVAGDAMDLTLLGAALDSRKSRKGQVATAIVAVLGVMALDLLCARQLSAREQTSQQ
jgi:hypothetical protein